MKYKFTGATRVVQGRTLHRVQRIADGVVGGFIEDEMNLGQSGLCWLFDDSVAYGNARIRDDAQVYGQIYDDASVSDRAVLKGSAFGRASISEDAPCRPNRDGLPRPIRSDRVSALPHPHDWARERRPISGSSTTSSPRRSAPRNWSR
jgi:hypothetical protein